MKTIIACILVQALTFPAVATDGWVLPPRNIANPDNSKAWFAPIRDGAAAFEVVKLGGAEGEVTFTEGSIRIVKTNDKGRIRVTPLHPVSLMPDMRRFRVSVEVESSSANPRAAKGYVRIGHRNANGEIGYNYAADGRALSGKSKLDQIIVTPKDRPQLKAAHFNREKGDASAVHVAIVVEGGASVSEWRDWRVDTVQEIERTNTRVRKGLDGRDFSCDMTDAAAFDVRLASDTDHTAKVIREDGFAKLTVDGKLVPPILYKGSDVVSQGLRFCGRRMHDAGFPLLVASVRFGSTTHWEGPWTTNGFDAVKAVDMVRHAMRTAPDALYVITVRLDAPVGWCDTRTNEIWRTKNGEVVYGNYVHLFDTPPNSRQAAWPWASCHSHVWRDETKKVLSAFIGELKRTGLSKRIVGYHVAGYHDAQFATGVPDWSEPARRAFVASGEKDYCRFLKRAPMELQDDFARHIRACVGKPIVVFRWCMGAFGSGFCSSHDIREFADSKDIDIIVPQAWYSYRSPGYAAPVKMPFSSLHLNGKLLMHEHDFRTYAVWPSDDTVVRDAGLSRATDIDEWCNIDHKMAGQMIARRTGFWYYDMDGGWFDTPEIAADIAAVIKAARPIYREKPTAWHPTAAFVIDEEDVLGLQRADRNCETANADINLYVENIAASGVPFDVYMKGDLDRHPEIAARYPYTILYNRYTPFKTSTDINAEAKAAGAYVPLPPNVMQVDMNGDFISIHCLVPGCYGFLLPRPCEVVNMKSGREETVHGNILPLDLVAGQTSWFRIK